MKNMFKKQLTIQFRFRLFKFICHFVVVIKNIKSIVLIAQNRINSNDIIYFQKLQILVIQVRMFYMIKHLYVYLHKSLIVQSNKFIHDVSKMILKTLILCLFSAT